MNSYIKIQIEQMLRSLDIFEQGCDTAALLDDDFISPEEKKQLAKIHRAVERFRDDLGRIQ